MDQVSKAWELLLMLGAGTGLVYILRWYWWRINAWSEVSAMASAFVVSLALREAGKSVPAFDTARPEGFALVLITTTILTTITWLTTTLLTSPEKEAVLRKFYLRVRPAGPGWAPLAAATGVHGAPGEIARNLWFWFLGVIFVYSIMFTTGALLFDQRRDLMIFGTTLLVSGRSCSSGSPASPPPRRASRKRRDRGVSRMRRRRAWSPSAPATSPAAFPSWSPPPARTAGRTWRSWPRSASAARTECRAACWRGRCPGSSTRGLWKALAERPPLPTRGLITDVGNDILYGASPARILEWVEESLARLRSLHRRRRGGRPAAGFHPPAVAGEVPRLSHLPLPPLPPDLRAGHRRRGARSPRASWAWPRGHGARFVALRPEWYGLDPVHFRPGRWGEAWREILGAEPSGGGAPSLAEALRLHALWPERQWLFGDRAA